MTTFDKELDREELLRRLPEIKLIEDETLREEVIQTFLKHCPEYFWSCPASSSGYYHQTDAVDELGLVLHTKRTFTALQRLGRSYIEQGRITEEEMDYARASILLHDLFKQGLPEDRQEKSEGDRGTVSNHDRIAKNYLEEHTELPNPVLELIDSHNGGWNEGKKPENDLEDLHHSADMQGSDRNQIAKVYKPCEEIEEVFNKKIFFHEGIEAEFD
jgi:hypothetical protein